MKKILCVILAVVLCLSACACGGEGGESGSSADAPGVFQIGFGRENITPEFSVHLGSYGDDDTRMSAEVLHDIFVNTVVLRGADGKTVVIATTDLSWGNEAMMNDLRPMVKERFGLESDEFLIGGIHNHNAPKYGGYDENNKYCETLRAKILDSIQTALNDLAPAEVKIGRTETENLTFVRRYLLENGDWTGDNYNYDHNSKIVSHESEADEEVQIVRFVREGEHKDIIMVNWQAHAAKHGHTNNISADFIGPLRDKVEEQTGGLCVFYQGACGNLNAISRIDGECPTGGTGYQNAVKCGEMVADVVLKALNNADVMKTIQMEKVQTKQDKFITDASFDEANTISCGDLSFVTLPAEFFDALGKTIKDDTPFEMTILLGYHCGKIRYLATKEGYMHGGYEPTNTRYRAGDGEKFVEHYLNNLKELYATK